MSLVLEIEFLTGECRAAHSPASGPDWPPQPDRVFSALVSSWATRGERSSERLALEWLEAQSPPVIHAGTHTVRTAPAVFVPPNDQRSSKDALALIPTMRPRQPRRFQVARLDDPVMAMVWEAAPSPEELAALDALARDVGYLGHSASLVRCRFVASSPAESKHAATLAARRVYSGRLQELERAHRLKPVRPMILSGATVLSEPPSAAPPRSEWLVLEAIGGGVPDIRAATKVARMLRRRLMGGYRSIGMADTIPEAVSGHASDGRPLRAGHLGIVPMAFAGYPYADGRVFGYAVVPEGQSALRDVPGFRAAFERIAPYDPGAERRVLKLPCIPGQPMLLSPAGGGAPKRSLMTGPYLDPARVWASVTPVVLDRHLKRYDEGRIRELIADSCANAGLPRPALERIQVGKHSATSGAPPAWPRLGAPPWTHWHVPEVLRSRLLTHVAIDFGCEVAGPVMLGAGRYTGLGLCRGLGGAAG